MNIGKVLAGLGVFAFLAFQPPRGMTKFPVAVKLGLDTPKGNVSASLAAGETKKSKVQKKEEKPGAAKQEEGILSFEEAIASMEENIISDE